VKKADKYGNLEKGPRLARRRERVELAIIYSYNLRMEVSTAEAKNRLSELIRAVEGGEQVVITRHGLAVAQIAPPPPVRRKARFDGMKGRIRLLPGWDDPITEEELLGEEN
jgi:prevent-host-death family protein